MKTKRMLTGIVLVALGMMAFSCKDKLRIVRETLTDAQVASSVLKSDIGDAQSAGLIGADEAAAVLKRVAAFDKAVGIAQTTVDNIPALDSGSRKKDTLAVLAGIGDTLKDFDFAVIKNEGFRKKVQLAVFAFQAILNSSEFVLRE